MKKEAKRLEKEAKLAAKALKTAVIPGGEKKEKVKPAKEKKEEEAPFVNTTPKGEKKGAHQLSTSRVMQAQLPRDSRYVAAYVKWIQPHRYRVGLVRLVGRTRLLSTEQLGQGTFRHPLPSSERDWELTHWTRLDDGYPGLFNSMVGTLDALPSASLKFRSRQRMLGRPTLFLPGFDHAGISTQSVVEKRLYKTNKQTRHDLGREKFLDVVMEWKNELVLRLVRSTSLLIV